MHDKELGLAGLNILVVEDDTLLRRQIVAQLERLEADVVGVGTLEQARQMLGGATYDFVLVDVHLPDGLGTELCRNRRLGEATGVVVMTADGEVTGAVEAMKLGALDYLVKPFEVTELALVLRRARRGRQAARLTEHRREEEATASEGFFFGQCLISLETQLDKILAVDERLRTHLAPVLIQGETGTGKTTIARWLHHRGPRADQPLVEVNCSALPETLAESELFGHERGAFTDARQTRMGLFEAAHGGSLFLDELPSLSLPLQAKVLTVIENHRVRRVGGNKEIPVDVRLIAAANCDLKAIVAQGRFREDLLHRLDLFRIQLPPLRDRKEDIPGLARLLLERVSRRHRVPLREISAAGLQRLGHYSWPGNVRELAHELERAVVFEEGQQLELAHLTESASANGPAALDAQEWLNPHFRFPESGFSLENAIARLIELALKQSTDNVSAAARLLGVSRDYVRYRLEGKKGDEG